MADYGVVEKWQDLTHKTMMRISGGMRDNAQGPELLQEGGWVNWKSRTKKIE